MGITNGQAGYTYALASYGVATGGTSSTIVVNSVPYTMLTITTTGNLVVSKSGLFDLFLVGGGGGGGSNGGGGGRSGGGAGGIVTATVYLPAATYTATVGTGSGYQAIGGSTSIGSTTIGSHIAPIAIGGGGYGSATPLGNWGNYPSGGVVTTNIPSQTNNGGAGLTVNDAGGGGGAGGAGGSGTGGTGGAGGAGYDASAWRGETAGTTRYAAGGGGGGATTGGAGGTGGGGAGGGSTGTGANATGYGCGGGGNGSGAAASGGTGSNGIILVRFKI